ncbi:hypothetical protein [Flavobacterium sp.]|uniref:hypothetical protein n=1 Tax=Flavobacterium sp. TaxID=239 RepID=UPI002625EBC4|nr:hypothetical protein [Flavobacterium sp.]
MRKIIQIAVFFSLIFCATSQSFGQQTASVDPDIAIKETLYTKYKKEVLSFDKKDFDALFFEFFQKQTDSKITLTKEEYYTYTIKIAIYSEKLGLLYKDQKEESDKAKQEWFNKSYAEYLKSKP